MELGAAADVDDEVRGWIIEAWREARRSVFDDFLPFDGRQVNRGFQINTGRLPGIVKSGHCQHAFLAKADCDRAYTIPE